jgi:hypothetical protein
VTTRRRGRQLAIPVAAVLIGAFAFGAWHVIVGGAIHGNPRAAMFGIVLAATSGIALVAVARLAGIRRIG